MNIVSGSDRKPIMRCLADVQPEPVEWLWPARIAIGKLSTIAGYQGLGKSFLTLDMAARVSNGSPWPDAPGVPQRAGGVVLVGAEDGAADTIVPRLMAMGADRSRITVLDGVQAGDSKRPWQASDVDELAKAVDCVPDCRLVVIDPISAFMPKGVDSHSTADVRGLLAPLAALAQEKRFALVIVSHLNKTTGASALDRVAGSGAFTAAARSAWLVSKSPHDEKMRVFVPLKNNLADTGGLVFRLLPPESGDGQPVVAWDDSPVHETADEVLAPPPRRRGPTPDARQRAETWLCNLLAGSGGEMPAREVEQAAADAGIPKRTIDRAKQDLGIRSVKAAEGWLWQLPPDGQDCQRAGHDNLGVLGNLGILEGEPPGVASAA